MSWVTNKYMLNWVNAYINNISLNITKWILIMATM